MKAITRWFRNAFSRLGVAGALLGFFWKRKVYWMIPLVAAFQMLSWAVPAERLHQVAERVSALEALVAELQQRLEAAGA